MITTNFIRRIAALCTGGNQSLIVSVVGPSGVGKTSLMASMCDCMESLVGGTDLRLSCRPEDADALTSSRSALQALFSKPETLWVDPLLGVPPTTDARDFRFWLGRERHPSDLMLHFFDFPGEWMSEYANANERGYVANLICKSAITLVPIDAPAMFESQAWHEDRNLPWMVTSLLEEAFQNLESPRLVVLVPLRCERYMHTAALRDQLTAKIQSAYRELLQVLKWKSDLVSVAVTPVQTLGQIEFVDSVERETYVPRFAKTSTDACYSPKDSDQPLRYILRFAMRQYMDRRDTHFSRYFRFLFGGDELLVRAAKEFAANCKADSGFAVLQGEEWLEMRGTR